MSYWLHSLPVLWMAILVFGFTYLITAGIYAVITVLAVGERARSFKAPRFSPLAFRQSTKFNFVSWSTAILQT